MKLKALILHNEIDLLDEEKYIRINIWERDFIKNFLLSGHTLEYDLIHQYSEFVMANPVDIIWFHARTVSYERVLEICSTLKPKFVIMSGDEYWFERLNHWNNLALHCNLFFRHHHHPDFTYESNVVHLPLGYTNGFYDQGDIYIPKMKARPYAWSHFGYPKTDRMEMINTFSKLEKYQTSWGVDPYVVREYYLLSTFVPCGRGNASLECYRLYEATMSGALPVIAGREDEIESTFLKQFAVERPPWIFSETWEDALEKCKMLLSDVKKLQELQDDNLKWWSNRMDGIKLQLNQFLEN